MHFKLVMKKKKLFFQKFQLNQENDLKLTLIDSLKVYSQLKKDFGESIFLLNLKLSWKMNKLIALFLCMDFP